MVARSGDTVVSSEQGLWYDANPELLVFGARFTFVPRRLHTFIPRVAVFSDRATKVIKDVTYTLRVWRVSNSQASEC